ncbi:hypothetical protein NKH18_31265 [Streptomyces sp. M10(2022)]
MSPGTGFRPRGLNGPAPRSRAARSLRLRPAPKARRSRWRTTLVVVAVAALLGGAAGLVAMKYAPGDGNPQGGAGSGAQSSAGPDTPTRRPPRAVPGGGRPGHGDTRRLAPGR